SESPRDQPRHDPSMPLARDRSLAARALVSFSLCRYGDLRDLHSFPTRRSSDLQRVRYCPRSEGVPLPLPRFWCKVSERKDLAQRSEEHTSELQSRGHLVCRLLLEKKTKLASLCTLRACRSTSPTS